MATEQKIEAVKMTQEKAVLKFIEQHGSITSMQAFSELGITRLSAKIFNLRKQGYDIKCDNITKKNRYGNAVTFAKYSLIKEVSR